MSEPLDESYLGWLYSQVGSVKTKDRSRTYWSLLRKFFTTEFVWLIPNDDNRMEDGRDLRLEFIQDSDIEDVDREWLDLGCSFLEMLIALSRRCSFEDGRKPRWWFWHMVENLRLGQCNDATYDEQIDTFVESVVNEVIFRRYDYDGDGGLFPLQFAEQDQRRAEIGYQFNAYLIEKEEHG